ncbi:hypothetical protein BGX28_005411 [Mortierella sp. GBA30]|nr:hypothetical protein BGX28_005411 [Mortierella sp. GBA30]
MTLFASQNQEFKVACNADKADSMLAFSLAEYASYLESHHKITCIPQGLDLNAKKRMLASLVYDCNDRLLSLERQRANDITALYNSWNRALSMTVEEEQHARRAFIHLLTDGKVGEGRWVEPPLQVDYGINFELGSFVTLGPNCVVLDCAPVSIGDRTKIGSGVMLFGATHPTNPLLRRLHWKWDFAMPIKIGRDCKIGGGALICPGVEIGDGVTVMEGSVITKNVPPYVVVAGAPASVVRLVDMDECPKEERACPEMSEMTALGLNIETWRPAPVATLTLP